MTTFQILRSHWAFWTLLSLNSGVFSRDAHTLLVMWPRYTPSLWSVNVEIFNIVIIIIVIIIIIISTGIFDLQGMLRMRRGGQPFPLVILFPPQEGLLSFNCVEMGHVGGPVS